jgi:hypothetical protein
MPAIGHNVGDGNAMSEKKTIHHSTVGGPTLRNKTPWVK